MLDERSQTCVMMSRPSANVAAPLLHDVDRDAQFDDLMLSCPEKIPLIAEGEHDAIVLSCRKQRRFRRDLLEFKLRIVSQGAAFGVVLPGYANLDFGPAVGNRSLHDQNSRSGLAEFRPSPLRCLASEFTSKSSRHSNSWSAWQRVEALTRRIRCRPTNNIHRLPKSWE